MKNIFAILLLFFGTVPLLAQDAGRRLPVIDVHLHSHSLADFKEYGPNPVSGAQPLQSVEEHIRKTFESMKLYNIVSGIVSGNLESVEQIRKSAPARIWAGPSYGIPGLDVMTNPDPGENPSHMNTTPLLLVGYYFQRCGLRLELHLRI